MKSCLIPAFLLLCINLSFGQTTPTGKLLIDDVTVLTGFAAEAGSPVNFSDFQRLAPESDLLRGDYSEFRPRSGSSNPFGGAFSVLLGLRFRESNGENYRSNPRLRLGVSYVSSTMLSHSYFQSTTTPYDTLTSSATGEMIFVDSVNNKNLNMDYQYQQIRLDVSLIFSTNPASRWSLYGGLGVSSGLSVNASSEIAYSEYDQTSRNDYFRDNIYFSDDEYIQESFQNETNFSTMVYVPLGVDFRLGKNKPFWKQLHLVYELRPMVQFTNIPELGNYSNVGINSMFGLRVKWNEI